MGFQPCSWATLEDIAPGIDCETIRQPLGVFAAIPPYNLPIMIPLWFWPYAVATGEHVRAEAG